MSARRLTQHRTGANHKAPYPHAAGTVGRRTHRRSHSDGDIKLALETQEKPTALPPLRVSSFSGNRLSFNHRLKVLPPIGTPAPNEAKAQQDIDALKSSKTVCPKPYIAVKDAVEAGKQDIPSVHKTPLFCALMISTGNDVFSVEEKISLLQNLAETTLPDEERRKIKSSIASPAELELIKSPEFISLTQTMGVEDPLEAFVTLKADIYLHARLDQADIKLNGKKMNTLFDCIMEISIPPKKRTALVAILVGILHDHRQQANQEDGADKWPAFSSPNLDNYQYGNIQHVYEELIHMMVSQLKKGLYKVGDADANSDLADAMIISALTDCKKPPSLKAVVIHHMNAAELVDKMSEGLTHCDLNPTVIKSGVIRHQYSPPFIMSIILTSVLMCGTIIGEAKANVAPLGGDDCQSQQLEKAYEKLGKFLTDPRMGYQLGLATPENYTTTIDTCISTYSELEGLDAETQAGLRLIFANETVQETFCAVKSLGRKLMNPRAHSTVDGFMDLSEKDMALLVSVDPRFGEHGWQFPAEGDSIFESVVRSDSMQYTSLSSVSKILGSRGPGTPLHDDTLDASINSITGEGPFNSWGSCKPLFTDPVELSFAESMRAKTVSRCQTLKTELRETIKAKVKEDTDLRADLLASSIVDAEGNFINDKIPYLDTDTPVTRQSPPDIIKVAQLVKSEFITVCRSAHKASQFSLA